MNFLGVASPGKARPGMPWRGVGKGESHKMFSWSGTAGRRRARRCRASPGGARQTHGCSTHRKNDQ